MNQRALLARLASQNTNSLFTKLSKLKESRQIEGIPCAVSDEQTDNDYNLVALKQSVQAYKTKKALEVVAVAQRAKMEISRVVLAMKEAIMKDLNMLIETKGKASFCEERKSPKEVGSTVANSLERQKTQDTPCFQLGINEICIDLREFTLGQKEKASSSKRSGSGQEQPADISEFSMHNVFKESSSKRIKDKIMNSGKTKLK